MQGGSVAAFSFLIELSFLNGLKKLEHCNAKVVTLLTY